MQIHKVKLPSNVWLAVLLLSAVGWGCTPPGPEELCRVPAGGTIIKYDGAAWSSQPSGTMCPLEGAWGTDANNVWAVGLAGTIVKSDGTSWSVQSSGLAIEFLDVWGSDANNVWAVGYRESIVKFDGTS